MKAASDALIALLADSNQLVMWEKYTITLVDGTVLQWTDGDIPNSGALIVNLNAPHNVGTESAAGITIAGLDPLANYALSLPVGLTYVGWSPYPTDGSSPVAGHAWRNNFWVTTGPGPSVGTSDPRSTMFGIDTLYIDAATAQAAFPGGSITGASQYTFWMFDAVPQDDRGGLSILLTVQP